MNWFIIFSELDEFDDKNQYKPNKSEVVAIKLLANNAEAAKITALKRGYGFIKYVGLSSSIINCPYRIINL